MLFHKNGEGQRSETNPKIKKIFLINKYFRYDGSPERAEIITALRNKVEEDANKSAGISKKSDYKKVYGPINEVKIQKSKGDIRTFDFSNEVYTGRDLFGTEISEEDQKKEYPIKDYSGQVVLNQDSLNAFSMLENTHTLDADYIYRDFKELIVELGYFTKEEITDETPRLLEWLVPSIKSKGYPEREVDKRENEFGTMIHSKGDIEASEFYSLETKIEETEKLEKLEKIELDESSEIEINVPTSDIHISTNGITYTHESKFDIEVNITLEEFLEIAADVHAKMENDSWAYCNGSDGHSGGNHDNGYPIEEHAHYNAIAEAEAGNHYADCSSYVCWVLQETGIVPDGWCTNSYGLIHAPEFENYILTREEAGAPIPGDILLMAHDDQSGHVQINGENNVQYSAGGTEAIRSKPYVSRSFIDGSENVYEYVIRLFDCEKYRGYDGNEMVVSPVTGILLEYGMYDGSQRDSINNDPYRVNVDLKYGPTVKPKEFISNIYSDYTGYAKILVLNKEYYKILEESTANSWNEENGKSLLTQNGTFRETLIDDKDSKALDKIKRSNKACWSDIDQMVYGYKEFAENYEKAGIAGYIVYIDGFVPELPDTSLKYVDNINKNIPYEDDIEAKAEAKLTIENYRKITPSNFTDNDSQLQSCYIEDEEYKTISTEYENKLKAETRIKAKASRTMYLADDDIIYIKEGTVLGRTMTDKELLESEEFRNGETGTFAENRKYTEGDNKAKDNIIGNYLRIIMRDLDGTPVENVEDYMKLGIDEGLDWFELFYWAPFECGGVDKPGCGPESVSSCTPGETAVGIAQWTDLTDPYHPGAHNWNIGNNFARGCYNKDPVLCEPLLDISEMDSEATWIDISGDTELKRYLPFMVYKTKKDKNGQDVYDEDGNVVYELNSEGEKIFLNCRYPDGHPDFSTHGSKIYKVLHQICEEDRESFLKIQMELAKEMNWDPFIKKYPWITKRPECVQAELFHLVIWGTPKMVNDILSKYNKYVADEVLLEEVRAAYANRSNTSKDATHKPYGGRAWNEVEIGYGILDGKLTKSDVEEWVRTGDASILIDNGVDIRDEDGRSVGKERNSEWSQEEVNKMLGIPSGEEEYLNK